MNERIEKLGEQADLLGEFTPTKIPGRYVGYITEEQILKFVELIVLECAKTVNDTEYPYEDSTHKETWDACCVWSAEKLKEHFGVES